MDHTAVVREKMTERYLLNELGSTVRDEFEEHYFDCPECALDVSAGSQFVENSKFVLAESSEPIPAPATPRPDSVSRGWFAWVGPAWLRPAFAAPALALLLAVAGYQNLVTYPRLRSELNQPQILPAVSVNMGTWGGSDTPASVPAGKGLLLYVRITPEASYARYTAELFNPAGKSVGAFTIPATANPNVWPVTVPGVSREAGSYTLAVHGVTAAGEIKNLQSTAFQLQIQR